MCGILWCDGLLALKSGVLNSLQSGIAHRGPDLPNESEVLGSNGGLLCASVLHIQGRIVTRQPLRLENGSGDMLVYNGEIFGGNEEMMAGGRVDGDTKLFARLIFDEIADYVASLVADTGVDEAESKSKLLSIVATKLVRNVEGPYAFIYYSRALDLLIYGRDPFGRRSLLSISNIEEGDQEEICNLPVALVSVVADDLRDILYRQGLQISVEELPVGGLFGLHPIVGRTEKGRKMLFASWPPDRVMLGSRSTQMERLPHSKISIDPSRFYIFTSLRLSSNNNTFAYTCNM